MIVVDSTVDRPKNHHAAKEHHASKTNATPGKCSDATNPLSQKLSWNENVQRDGKLVWKQGFWCSFVWNS